MAAESYPLAPGGYKVFSASNDKDYFKSALEIVYDVSKWIDMVAFLIFDSWAGTPTSLDIDIESAFEKSDVDNDWLEVVSFTQLTAGTATQEYKATTGSFIFNFLRIRITFVGGSSPTWTGNVYVKHLGKVAD